MLTLTSAQSEELPEIVKIDIDGNRKIEEDAIRGKLKTRVGQILDAKTVRDDVQALFDMGFFYNIKVDRRQSNEGLVVKYTVFEKPIVAEILFEDNEELDDDELREVTDIKAYEILNINKVIDAAEKIEKLYEDKGFFLAQAEYRLEDILVEGTKAKRLTFKIRENEKVQVKEITFIGNKQLKKGFLKSRIQTQEGGLFSFLSGSGAYKQDAFDQDVRILQSIYFNEGYVQVKIDRPEVYVTPDKKGIYITIRVEEGDKFDVGNVDFSGDLLFDEEELYDTVELDEGGTFVPLKMQADLRALTAKYGDLGYAFTNVIPRTKVRPADRKVDITFEIDKGNKVYFGKISVTGNTKTRDKVVRRELRIIEGELYNETNMRKSQNAVRRLGFFEEVNFTRSTPENKPDILNINIVVKERNTGTIQVGAGFSSFSGFIFNGQVNQTNFLGKGQRLSLSVDLSDRNSLFNLGFTEPYFLDTKWSLGFDAFRSVRDFVDRFDETKKGGAIRVGHPLGENVNGIIRYKLDDTETVLDGGDPDLFPVETVNGITSSLTFSVVYDVRNDRFAPSKGMFASTSIEYAGLGGDLEYSKLTSNFRYYKRLFWDVIWRNNFNYGFITSNNDNDPPFNELFLLGGANSLRGFDFFSIGKTKRSSLTNTDEPFGGEQQVFVQTELEFPMIREAGIKGVVFVDAGEAEDDFSFSEFRSNWGFGFRWFSPIGPLRFEWGFPIAKRDGESASNFQFAIGSPF